MYMFTFLHMYIYTLTARQIRFLHTSCEAEDIRYIHTNCEAEDIRGYFVDVYNFMYI